MSKSSIMFLETKTKLFNEALKQLDLALLKSMEKHNAKFDANEVIQQAIDFGIEKETPKLKADEKLSVKVNLIPNVGFKVDVLRVKKT